MFEIITFSDVWEFLMVFFKSSQITKGPGVYSNTYFVSTIPPFYSDRNVIEKAFSTLLYSKTALFEHFLFQKVNCLSTAILQYFSSPKNNVKFISNMRHNKT